MKNSVWHYKFWKKKLNELPVDVDLNTAWSEMQSILDKDLPLADFPKGRTPVKTFTGKIVSMLGYILPVAAMIVGITYFTIKSSKKEKPSITKHINKNSLLKVPDTLMDSDSVKDILSSNVTNSANTNQAIAYTTSNGIDTDEDPISSQISSNNPDNTEIIKTLPDLSNQQLSRSTDRGEIYSNAPGSTIQNTGFFTLNTRMASLSAYKKWNEKEETPYKKTGSRKSVKIKQRREIYTPKYNYSVEAGLNVYKSNQNIFLGANATYAINKRLLLNTGLRLSFANALEGSYTHPNYNLKDSASKENLIILDQRKLTTADIPLGLEYKISNRISIKAGPVISLLLSKGIEGSKLSTVKNPLDTIFNSKKINDALSRSTINKLNIGFSGGLNIRLKQFNIEAGYRQNLKPYKVSSDLGSYKKEFRTFQIGIGYNFK
ncbi:hypothetical protein [Pedobacter sp. V48]|uniref:hypothetical protein n=1 Tax=Pedobacter sp. V48 TaxID=509635 RepID=UPI0003E594B7|nr:hypothetical protein [Pedobacter sp. V48]ETZ19642.1 hypothetical protein N824_09230 [Pedobacter sp. V48]